MSKKQINDWRIEDFTEYNFESGFSPADTAYLFYEADPALDYEKPLPPRSSSHLATFVAEETAIKFYPGANTYQGSVPTDTWADIVKLYTNLLKAVKNGRLPLRDGLISRDVLKSFFQESEQRPRFLFPEKRNGENETVGSGKNPSALFQPGLKWEDITITLHDRDLVSIKTPTSEERYSPAELKMTDKRKGNQTKEVWRTLMLFCLKTGFVSSENTTSEEDLPGKAKRLNKAMQDLFNIKESIFNSHYKNKSEGLKGTLKVAGYQTKARFRSTLSLNGSEEEYINDEPNHDLEQRDNVYLYKRYDSVSGLDDTDDE